MSVLINIPFPRCCSECRFERVEFKGETDYCSCDLFCVDNNTKDVRGFGKLRYCPLAEVPFHGDLIDRDELLCKLEIPESYSFESVINFVSAIINFVETVKNAPVVIESEVKE